MNLDLAPEAQNDLAGLDALDRERVFDAILRIPSAFRDPARHTGLGLRKLHPRGYWEIRAGLRLRVVFRLGPDRALLVRIADHDEIRRFLRSL